MSGLAKLAVLYLGNLKATLRFAALLVAALLALIALVLISLPQQMFSASNVPQISLALVYGDGSEHDELLGNLTTELNAIETVGEIRLSTPGEAEAQLAGGEVDAVVTLPEETLDVLIYGGHASIEVKANDPVIGSVVYTVAYSGVEALDSIQNYALTYAEEAQGRFDTSEEYQEAVSAFYLKLLTEALMRLNSVDVPWQVSPFYAQALTLLLFMAVSISSLYVATLAARQYATGYIRRLALRGVRFGHLYASQLLLSASTALVLGFLLWTALSLVGEGLSLPVLLASSVLLSLVLTALYLLFSGFRQQPQVAVTRTLLGGLALLFFMLFAGGGFYPTGLMQLDVRLFNPTWLSHQLAVWSLGGSLNLVQLAYFMVPLVLASAANFVFWRRAL